MINDKDISNLKSIVSNAIREVAGDRKQVFNMITFEADFLTKIKQMQEELIKLKSKKKK